jgi:L-ascorbate metabolism protein UlaG (beta-lactamase superfamily)
LAELFPKIDYFTVGIGAYNLKFVMQKIHQNHEEAFLIPMHYKTFDLTNEPLKLLNQKAFEFSVNDKIKVLKINESVVLT